MAAWNPGPGATSGDDEFVGDASADTANGLAGEDTLNGADEKITRVLGEAVPDATKIIITHRLSTVRDADQIFVLDRGQIVEQVDHDALVALRGRYSSLSRSQIALMGAFDKA